MSCAVADDRADEAVRASQRERSHEIQRRPMPDGFEELAIDGEARLRIELARAVNEDVLLVVAPVPRRGKKFADGLGEHVLAVRGIRPGERGITEGLGRHVKQDALLADDGVP